MLAMALLLHGGLLGGVGGEAAGVGGSGEGAWTLATPAVGFLAASGAGELTPGIRPDARCQAQRGSTSTSASTLASVSALLSQHQRGNFHFSH